MTREEASKVIKDGLEDMSLDFADEEQYEALNMAIKALEQEPSGDLISRQAVNTLVDELARAISDERCCMSRGRSTATIMQDILDLPSVKQEPKTGHWIENAPEYQNIDPPYICSECGNMHLKKTNYCDQCGAKMVEPQESEEQDADSN